MKRKQPLLGAIQPQSRETHRDTDLDSSEVKCSDMPWDTGEEASGHHSQVLRDSTKSSTDTNSSVQCLRQCRKQKGKGIEKAFEAR